MENEGGLVNTGGVENWKENGLIKKKKRKSLGKHKSNDLNENKQMVRRDSSASVVRTSPAYVLDEKGLAGKTKNSMETLRKFAHEHELSDEQSNTLETIETGVDDIINVYIREISTKLKIKNDLNTAVKKKTEALSKPNSKLPPWVPDEEQNKCWSCNTGFGVILNRKHHCRKCGNIFHDKCAPHFMEIKEHGYKDPVRICTACHKSLVRVSEKAKPQKETTKENMKKINPFKPSGILADIKKPQSLKKVETPKQTRRSQNDVLMELKSSLKKRSSARKSRFNTPKQKNGEIDENGLEISPIRNLDYEIEVARSGKKQESDRKRIESLLPKTGPIANLISTPIIQPETKEEISPTNSWN